MGASGLQRCRGAAPGNGPPAIRTHELNPRRAPQSSYGGARPFRRADGSPDTVLRDEFVASNSGLGVAMPIVGNVWLSRHAHRAIGPSKRAGVAIPTFDRG